MYHRPAISSQGGGVSGAGRFQGRKVILGVSGGIAAYKAALVARALVQEGAAVHCVMTGSARRFIGAQTLASLTGHPVLTEIFSDEPDVPHVELARGADLLVVAPATANTLAKMASGIADDALSATFLSCSCPVLAAAAMHTEMWENAATRANIAVLAERGVFFVGPDEGELTSGDFGPGRLSEPDAILAAAAAILSASRELSGRTVLVTAGGTQEPLDPVRFIGNRSSGRMGYEIAIEASRRGAKVVLVKGPTNLPVPPGLDVVEVRTAQEMHDAVVERAPSCDVIIKAAAVADFRPETAAERKLKKAEGPPEVKLLPTPDILAELGANARLRKPGGVLVGFAAETEPDPNRLARLAREKRRAKGADLIVANDVSSPDSGFSVPTNRAVIAGPGEETDVGLVTKRDLAKALIDRVAEMLSHDTRGLEE
ncbi:MAG TPA: bifunctional phosphopantothenoylcysteine decarboxylase/phosphopantothenate--cysteine ligase CoaBC [Actinomycetota bacterium]|nr:bifunctional phosphopantothenoylcysteine decarboxylase/phosphopantothenate--cysteine ligase CoaBC [Actinomycetota bacterium]